MTIGYILDDTLDKEDGVQKAMLDIGEAMRGRGHDVHYIVANTKRTDIKNVHSVGKFVSMKFNGNSVRTPMPASAKAVKQLFDDVEFDVLHVQMPFSPFLASRVLNMAPAKVKKVGTFHILPYGMLSTAGTKAAGFAMRRTIKSLDTVYAVSEPSRQFMERSFGVVGAVLPNPVDYKFFANFRIKRSHNNSKKIVFVGRFDERKGVRELVSAYAGMSTSMRANVSLVMCGKGPLVDQVRKLSDDNSLGVEFPGFVTLKQKAQLLADADIAVFPSISGESFGIVLTEAMAAGSGVTLGGNNPGYSSVLRDWPETLFDPKDTAAFSKKLEEFLINDSLREQIGAQQHEAVKRYDTDTVVDRLMVETYT